MPEPEFEIRKSTHGGRIMVGVLIILVIVTGIVIYSVLILD